MQIARKITIGGLNGVRKGFKGITEETFVARIVGIVQSSKVEEGQLGSYIKFTGEFQGTNMDGLVTMAPVCMLPEPAASMLHTAVNESEGSVKFGFDFFVVPDESVAIGYKYSITPLIETKPSNPLTDMLATFRAIPVTLKQPQLNLSIVDKAEKKAEEPKKSIKKA